MTAYILRRLLQSLALIAVMSVIVFFGVNIVGDPVWLLVNPQMDQKDIEEAVGRWASTGRSGSSTCYFRERRAARRSRPILHLR